MRVFACSTFTEWQQLQGKSGFPGRVPLGADWLRDLWGSGQNENVRPLIQKFNERISGQHQQSIEPDTGPSEMAQGAHPGNWQLRRRWPGGGGWGSESGRALSYYQKGQTCLEPNNNVLPGTRLITYEVLVFVSDPHTRARSSFPSPHTRLDADQPACSPTPPSFQ